MSVEEHCGIPAGVVIRPLDREPRTTTLEAVAQLMARAYPVMGVDSVEKLAAYARDLADYARDPDVRWIVAEAGVELAGAMKLYDFTMNVRGADAPAGGVGGLAVALAHKRRGIARSLISWYLEHYRGRGTAFAVLHPFRPDFYRRMGFGYGTPVHRYRFAPGRLRVDGARGTARDLDVSDLDAVLECSERVRAKTNGLIAKQRPTAERALLDLRNRYVGVEADGVLRAFMQTTIALGAAGHANDNALVIRDFNAEEAGASAALLGYLHTQRDQFAEIVIETQDDAMFLAADDPRDGSNIVVTPPATHRVAETGLGVMYRLLDVPRAFAHLATVEVPFTMQVVVRDAFFAPTAGAWMFRFSRDQAPRLDERSEPDAVLSIDCADLSSLVVGSLRLRSLIRHRLATLEPETMLESVERAFYAPAAPFCQTRF